MQDNYGTKKSINLHAIEKELKFALDKINLFVSVIILEVARNTETIVEDETRLRKIVERTSKSAVSYVVDKNMKCPKAPRNLIIIENIDSFDVSWDRTEDKIVAYEVMYDTSKRQFLSYEGSQFENKEFCTVKITWPQVEPGNLYAMKVRAINGGGPGEWSKEQLAQLSKPIPQQPRISQVILWSTMAKIITNVVELICTTQSPITCWEISYATDTQGEWTTFILDYKPGKDSYKFMVHSLLPDNKYFFRIKAMNKEGWSVPSEIICGHTRPLPDKPLKPCTPSIIFYTPTDASITVVAPENIATMEVPILGWEIRYFLNEWKTLEYKTELMEKTSTITIPGIQKSKTYQFSVRALNEAGWSECSETVVKHSGRPCKPENIRRSGKRSHSVIKIRWSAPEKDSTIVTHYEVNKGNQNHEFDNKFHSITAKYLSATFQGLKHNTIYTFRVRSVNDTLESEWSDVLTVNTRIHKVIKGVFSPFVWALGTVSAPIMGPLGGGIAGGMAGGRGRGKAAAAAGGVAGTAGGVVLGTVGAPLMGAACAHVFVHGMDELSDQSDDESDPESIVKYINS